MKYTKEEVLDILKLFTDTPEEVLEKWEIIKANTPLDLEKDPCPCFVYTFPLVIEGKVVADITLLSLYGGNSQDIKPDLMLKYFGKEKWDLTFWCFSHDTYLDCYLTVYEEFDLPIISKGEDGLEDLHGGIFKGVDAKGEEFEFKVSYGYGNEINYGYWKDGGYLFTNDVSIKVKKMNGFLLGEEINKRIKERLKK